MQTQQSKTGKRLLIIALVCMLVLAGAFGANYQNLLPGARTAQAAGPVQETSSQNGAALAPAPALASAGSSATMVAEQQQMLADLYDQILPSVVNIQVTKSSSGSQLQVPDTFPFGPLPGIPQPQPQEGEGSGWIYDAQGHIITNNHVVDGADSIVVIFYNGFWADAEVVATDPQADLAVLKVDTPSGMTMKPLTMAPPDNLRVGYSVIAIGSPFGNDRTMTVGIVSALGRSFPVGQDPNVQYTLPDVIQTDAAINPGNSGGPLLNLNGEVIGVNFAINSPIRASSGIGFAIPVAIVDRVVPALIKDGSYAYPYLGISGQSITPQVAKELKLSNNMLGARVGAVQSNGPSAKAGLKEGDIIVGINDARVASFDDLVGYLVTKSSPGDKVTLQIQRGDKKLSLDVTLSSRPSETAISTSDQGQPGQAGSISAARAISIAKEAVQSAGIMDTIASTSAKSEVRGGVSVWVVQMSDGSSKTANIVVDGQSGDVLEIVVQTQ